MKEERLNPFDESARIAKEQAKKKELEAKKKREQPSQKANADKNVLFGSEATTEMDYMLNRIREMHNDLEQKVNYIMDNKHLLPKQLHRVFDDPESLGEQHVKNIETVRRAFEDELINLLASEYLPAPDKKADKKELKRGRKAHKLRGRRGWISMD
jgi:hypothetical protein